MTRPDLDAIRARVWSISTTASTFAGDVAALLAHIDELREEHAHLKHREVMLKRAHGALADAGYVVPIEIDKTIEHAINALAERALTAEERLERVTHERDQERTVFEQENLALRRELARIMDDH
jgi:phage shock protein A